MRAQPQPLVARDEAQVPDLGIAGADQVRSARSVAEKRLAVAFHRPRELRAVAPARRHERDVASRRVRTVPVIANEPSSHLDALDLGVGGQPPAAHERRPVAC